MASKSVGASWDTHAHARRLADQRQTTLGNVIADTIDQMERPAMLGAYNAAVARMRAKPVAWGEYDADLAGWEGKLADGLKKSIPMRGLKGSR